MKSECCKADPDLNWYRRKITVVCSKCRLGFEPALFFTNDEMRLIVQELWQMSNHREISYLTYSSCELISIKLQEILSGNVE